MTRRVVHLLAVWSVLLHAAFVVRHAAAMWSSAGDQASIASLGVICHVDDLSGKTLLPDAPAQDDQNASKCPVCLGMSPAVAVLAEAWQLALAPDLVSARNEIVAETIRYLSPRRLPPPRGPPLTA